MRSACSFLSAPQASRRAEEGQEELRGRCGLAGGHPPRVQAVVHVAGSRPKIVGRAVEAGASCHPDRLPAEAPHQDKVGFEEGMRYFEGPEFGIIGC